MKIDRVRQLESVTDFGQETSLIRDVLDNLELEQSLTWLLEAINTHLENGAEKEPWHLYQTTLFAMYVDYDNGQVRLSAMLACHDADMELPLKDFLEILRREAREEANPRHFSEADTDTQIQAEKAGTGAGQRILFMNKTLAGSLSHG